jgi:hypothetical protein
MMDSIISRLKKESWPAMVGAVVVALGQYAQHFGAVQSGYNGPMQPSLLAIAILAWPLGKLLVYRPR